jgi:hypothetical protein
MRRIALLSGLGSVLAACGGPVNDGALDEEGTTRAALNPAVVINEHASGSAGWVELFNDSDSAADISGWIVDDILSGGTAPKVLPAGSVIPARGLLVVAYAGFNAASADTVNLLDTTKAVVDSHPNGYGGSSVAGLCFGRQPDGGPWASGAVPCSKGESNAGSAPPPALVVINEFQPGASGWVELYNPGQTAADLSGWFVDDVANGGTSPKSLGAAVTLPAKGFLVVAYGGVNTASTDMVRLVDNGGAAVDSHSNFYAGSSITGLCFGRQPDGGAWAAAGIPCSQGAANSGGTPPPPPAVLINEFQPGSAGWVELFNAGAATVELMGWKVDDVAGGGASPKAIPAGTTVAPGQVVRVAFAGINTASADEVRLLDPGGIAVDAHANYFGTDPCYGVGRCYGRLPDGGAWAPGHIPCTGGTSNPATAPELCVPGQACNDGDACTTGDTCSSTCVCTAGPALACDDQNPCTTDACWPETGCTHPAAPDGIACGSGQQCQGGVCGGTEPTGCVATGGTYKTVVFTQAEECQAVLFLNKARYSQMNPIVTTARDIAYDCSPGNTCGYRSAAWSTVAQYAAANGGSSSLTVGTASLAALRTASAAFIADGLWYDTVAHAFANKAMLNNLWLHFESVFAESRNGLCLLVRDAPGAVNYLSACVDPWYCGPEGCPADYLEQYVGKKLSVRGRLTNETGSWKVVVKTIRNANPSVP